MHQKIYTTVATYTRPLHVGNAKKLLFSPESAKPIVEMMNVGQGHSNVKGFSAAAAMGNAYLEPSSDI
jgi:hypothetical protein